MPTAARVAISSKPVFETGGHMIRRLIGYQTESCSVFSEVLKVLHKENGHSA